MYRIWSSSFFYYSADDEIANCIRLQVRLTEPVDAAILEKAASVVHERYPYLAVRAIENWHEIRLEANGRPFVVRKGAKPFSLGSEESNRHLLAFSYDGNDVYINAFHGLVDGQGLFFVLKTLLYVYCCEKYGELPNDFGARLPGEIISPEEYVDPYFAEFLKEKGKRAKTERNASNGDNPLKAADSAEAAKPHLMVSKEGTFTRCPVINYKILLSQADMMNYCQRQDGSPVTSIALFMSRAVHSLLPDSDKLITCSIAANLRPAFGVRESHHSTVAPVVLDYFDELNGLDFELQGTAFRGQMMLRNDPELIAEGFSNTNAFYKKLVSLPFTKQKRKLSQSAFMMSIEGDTINISYTGKIDLGSCEKFVERMYLEAEAPKSDVFIEILAVNDVFCLSFMQSCEEEIYLDAFCRELTKAGVSYRIESKSVREIGKAGWRD